MQRCGNEMHFITFIFARIPSVSVTGRTVFDGLGATSFGEFQTHPTAVDVHPPVRPASQSILIDQRARSTSQGTL